MLQLILQSFSPKDKISPEQANEIGKRLCEELYSNYQCVISTHIDRGHIHNHISLNVISLDGKKLEDIFNQLFIKTYDGEVELKFA